MSELEKNKEGQTVFKEESQLPAEAAEVNKGKTSSGMDENVAGLLCYLFTIITGIIFLVIEKENRFVRFHAMQSVITFGAVFVFSIVINIIPLLGLLVSVLLVPLTIILWIFLMMKAYQGKWFKLPIIGDFAEKQLNKVQ